MKQIADIFDAGVRRIFSCKRNNHITRLVRTNGVMTSVVTTFAIVLYVIISFSQLMSFLQYLHNALQSDDAGMVKKAFKLVLNVTSIIYPQKTRSARTGFTQFLSSTSTIRDSKAI